MVAILREKVAQRHQEAQKANANEVPVMVLAGVSR